MKQQRFQLPDSVISFDKDALGNEFYFAFAYHPKGIDEPVFDIAEFFAKW